MHCLFPRGRWRPVTLLLLIVVFCSLSHAAWAQEATEPARAVALPAIDLRVENSVKALTLYLARFVEGAAALVIGIAAIRALWGYFVVTFGPKAKRTTSSTDDVRLGLGRSLALALEFELAADVLQTAVAPTWNEVGLLAAIAVLRTGLNYFLEKELRNAEARDTGTTPEGMLAKVDHTADERRAG